MTAASGALTMAAPVPMSQRSGNQRPRCRRPATLLQCSVLNQAAMRWSFLTRRGDRAAEGAALEMLCGGNLTAGSNPALSAFNHPGCRRALNMPLARRVQYFRESVI